MSESALLDPPASEAHAGHGHESHHPFHAHHFETLEQQFDAGKLGIWLFLAQEVLFFSGLFAAYTVYRFNHSEVFREAHRHLNTTLGAINTIVLLASSLAIAWGVRAAQRNDRKTVLHTHVFTLACAALFMGIKTVEYTHKWDEGIAWAGAYSHVEHSGDGHDSPHAAASDGLHAEGHGAHGWGPVVQRLAIGSLLGGVAVTLVGAWMAGGGSVARGWVVGSLGISIASLGMGIVVAKCVMPTEAELAMAALHAAHSGDEPHGSEAHSGDVQHAAEGVVAAATPEAGMAAPAGQVAAPAGQVAAPAGQVAAPADQVAAPDGEMAAGAAEGEVAAATETGPTPLPPNPRFGAPNFFSLYFFMTGLHALHIIAGMMAITWIVGRAAANHFSSEYYGPIEYVGLYWHLVDLIWIYLFPLLYLIH